MKFKLKKWKIFNRVLLVVLSAYVIDSLIPTVNLSFIKGVVTVLSACFVYFVLRTQNEVYTMKQKSIILTKSKKEVPFSEIDGLSRVGIPLLHKLGLKGEMIGYHYFLSYDGHQYELLASCKNEDNKSIIQELPKKTNLKYTDVENMRVFIKAHKAIKSK